MKCTKNSSEAALLPADESIRRPVTAVTSFQVVSRWPLSRERTVWCRESISSCSLPPSLLCYLLRNVQLFLPGSLDALTGPGIAPVSPLRNTATNLHYFRYERIESHLSSGASTPAESGNHISVSITAFFHLKSGECTSSARRLIEL